MITSKHSKFSQQQQQSQQQTTKRKNKKEAKLAHFAQGLNFKKNKEANQTIASIGSSTTEQLQLQCTSGEEEVNDEFYQSIEPHIINSENRLLYFDHLCVASQFPPLLTMKLFPNGKEITESLSAYNSIRDYFEFKKEVSMLSNRNVVCYVIADGNVPRTAAIFACATNWRVFSIDPRMKQKWICKYEDDVTNGGGGITNTNTAIVEQVNTEGQQPKEEQETFVKGLEATPSIQRLYPFSMTSTEFLNTQLFKKVQRSCTTTTLSVIVAVHSHANLSEFYNEIPSPKLCLEIPCCFKPNIKRAPITVFTDEALHSEKNTIYMWQQQ